MAELWNLTYINVTNLVDYNYFSQCNNTGLNVYSHAYQNYQPSRYTIM